MDFPTQRSVYVGILKINTVFNLLAADADKSSSDPIQLIESTWSLQTMNLAQELKCDLFSKVVSSYANPKSFMDLFKVQAEFIKEAQLQKLDYISILKPGLLLGRRHNPKAGTGCLSRLFCMKIIEVINLAV